MDVRFSITIRQRASLRDLPYQVDQNQDGRRRR